MYVRKDRAPAGTAGLSGIVHAHRNAELADDVVLTYMVPQDFGAPVLR